MRDVIKHWVKNVINFFTVKPLEQPSHQAGCQCQQREGYFFDRRQANRMVALSLLAGLTIFIGGYFWGQHVATDQLLSIVERDSFADQVYYSMCSLTDQKEEDGADTEEGDGEQDDEQAVSKTPVAQPSPDVTQAVKPLETKSPEAKPQEAKSADVKLQTLGSRNYYAQLAGFGTAHQAQQFLHRLTGHDIAARVQRRESKGRNGRTIVWYQVVTEDNADRAALEKVVNQIKVYEKLHDIRMVER